mmetsp:Transcript_90630/g.255907  ORF Transcript_90630/g.255907 Transcript_90630/m.255907 type:complete len:246 (+) Transcript_90630:1340-2077(+)
MLRHVRRQVQVRLVQGPSLEVGVVLAENLPRLPRGTRVLTEVRRYKNQLVRRHLGAHQLRLPHHFGRDEPGHRRAHAVQPRHVVRRRDHADAAHRDGTCGELGPITDLHSGVEHVHVDDAIYPGEVPLGLERLEHRQGPSLVGAALGGSHPRVLLLELHRHGLRACHLLGIQVLLSLRVLRASAALVDEPRHEGLVGAHSRFVRRHPGENKEVGRVTFRGCRRGLKPSRRGRRRHGGAPGERDRA